MTPALRYRFFAPPWTPGHKHTPGTALRFSRRWPAICSSSRRHARSKVGESFWKADLRFGRSVAESPQSSLPRLYVSLSGRAHEILEGARDETVLSDLVYRSPSGRALSDSTLGKLRPELGAQAAPHEFRSSLGDRAAECTNVPHAVMGPASSRVVGNNAEPAYARSDPFERRRAMLDDWSSHLARATAEI